MELTSKQSTVQAILFMSLTYGAYFFDFSRFCFCMLDINEHVSSKMLSCFFWELMISIYGFKFTKQRTTGVVLPSTVSKPGRLLKKIISCPHCSQWNLSDCCAPKYNVQCLAWCRINSDNDYKSLYFNLRLVGLCRVSMHALPMNFNVLDFSWNILPPPHSKSPFPECRERW